MTHLTPDELIDAMEGLLSEERQAHLATCEQCQRELAGLSSALSEAKQVSVPEPSPLFWPNFSQRVRMAIDRGRRHRHQLARLVAMAGAAAARRRRDDHPRVDDLGAERSGSTSAPVTRRQALDGTRGT